MAVTYLNFGEAPRSSVVDRFIGLARISVASLGSFALLVSRGVTIFNPENDLEGSDPLDSEPDYMDARVSNIYE
ncbi:hypothetical protein H6800_00375 [Candidatus Nomurabacteria bacterium]|nr:hypothetical protein [Candidatus Nomurabacteria bacterium]